MSTDLYQTAYEHTIDELAEINVQLEKLIRRKQLLEQLLEPLRQVAESAPVTAPAADTSISELSVGEESPQASAVILVEVPEAEASPFEVETSANEPETEAPNHSAESNGRYFSDDQVADLAYHFWSEGGRVHGRHEDDWLRAAQELQNTVTVEMQNSA